MASLPFDYCKVEVGAKAWSVLGRMLSDSPWGRVGRSATASRRRLKRLPSKQMALLPDSQSQGLALCHRLPQGIHGEKRRREAVIESTASYNPESTQQDIKNN